MPKGYQRRVVFLRDTPRSAYLVYARSMWDVTSTVSERISAATNGGFWFMSAAQRAACEALSREQRAAEAVNTPAWRESTKSAFGELVKGRDIECCAREPLWFVSKGWLLDFHDRQ